MYEYFSFIFLIYGIERLIQNHLLFLFQKLLISLFFYYIIIEIFFIKNPFLLIFDFIVFMVHINDHDGIH